MVLRVKSQKGHFATDHTQTDMKGIIALVLCSMLLLQGYCQEAGLTPSEYVAYEGQPDFTFQCTGPDLQRLVFLVDGKQLGSASQIQRGISISDHEQLGDTYQRNITISATQANKNTTIECLAGNDTSTFMVQGSLDPPINITDWPIEYNHFYQNLTWTAPFTLDITDLEPDITYRVCNTYTNTCVDTAGAFNVFEKMCDPVEYYISACNPVGCGENATTTLPKEPIKFNLTKVEFMYNNESEPMVYIELESETFCLRTYFGVLEYLLGSELNSTEIGPIEPLVDGKTHTIILTQANGIVENANYTGQIGSEGMMIPTEGTMETGTVAQISFYTFDVLNFTATYEDGTITVTCIFVRGSNAQGCLVKFCNLNGLVERNITLRRQPSGPEDTQSNSSDTLNDLPDGEYEVKALDIESDGSVTNDSEPVKRKYTFPPSSPTTSPTTDSPTTDSSLSDSSTGIIAGVVGAIAVVIISCRCCGYPL